MMESAYKLHFLIWKLMCAIVYEDVAVQIVWFADWVSNLGIHKLCYAVYSIWNI